MTPTQDITPDTTIYLIAAGNEVQWYAAADTAEEAVAEAIAGIGLTRSVIAGSPFRVSEIPAETLAECDDGTLSGMRQAEREAESVRTYDHEKALDLSEGVDSSKADDRIQALDERLGIFSAA
jgi:hypothetical protein